MLDINTSLYRPGIIAASIIVNLFAAVFVILALYSVFCPDAGSSDKRRMVGDSPCRDNRSSLRHKLPFKERHSRSSSSLRNGSSFHKYDSILHVYFYERYDDDT